MRRDRAEPSRHPQYTVRCEVSVGGAVVSVKLVLSDETNGEEFRAFVWQEFLTVLNGHGVGHTFLPTSDVEHYVVGISGRHDIDIDLQGRLRPQLPKPCLLTLSLGRWYTATAEVVAAEAAGRTTVEDAEAEESGAVCQAACADREKATAAATRRVSLAARSREFEGRVFAIIQGVIEEERREAHQFAALLKQTKAYLKHARCVADEVEEATRRKRMSLTLAKALFAATQRANDSWHTGTRDAKLASENTIDKTILYAYPMQHTQHRFELETVETTSALRQSYMASHKAGLAHFTKLSARPVCLPSDPLYARKRLQNSRLSIKELVASQQLP
eukprot:Rhum_TRINITY_DN640_c0_g1::Rhum_TRINITY_DN640_c0_g1_i1::g.2039::m.2039